ncbi:MAG: hypothetical protein AAFQ41_00235 [Cyanobacteria bacterium J06623_7]
MLSDNLTDKLNPVGTKAPSWFSEATERASGIDNYLMRSLSDTVEAHTATWLAYHPKIAWLFGHPIIALITGLIAVVLIIRLVLTLYKTIASTIDRIWLAILRSPWTMLKFLFGWSPKSKTISSKTTITNYEVTSDAVKLQEIVTRLDLIQQQQQEIIRELTLLKQQPLAIKPQLQLTEKKITGKQ